MRYYMPTLVWEEPDCVAKHSAEFKKCGKRALLVTGRSSAAKNGSLGDVQAALEKEGISHCLFSEVEENPSVETVMKAAEYAREEGADFAVGIGGGSPMDAAKAIALLMTHPGAGEEELYNGSLMGDAAPVAAVPTTCGTGSEVTGVSVLTRHSKKTKVSIPYRIFPKVAFLDGKYSAAAPWNIVVSTAVDALAHLLESGCQKSCDKYGKMLVRAGLEAWAVSKDVLSGNKEAVLADDSAMLHASALAGMAIAQTGTSIPHALSYLLTYEKKIPHGRAAGFFLPAFLREAPTPLREELLGWAGFSDVEDFATFCRL